jgi:hypothetical protein
LKGRDKARGNRGTLPGTVVLIGHRDAYVWLRLLLYFSPQRRFRRCVVLGALPVTVHRAHQLTCGAGNQGRRLLANQALDCDEVEMVRERWTDTGDHVVDGDRVSQKGGYQARATIREMAEEGSR